MKAAVYENFGGEVAIRDVEEPVASEGGVVLKVKACGICRSDWYGWKGNDPDISLPHVPGHELAGEIVETGSKVSKWKIGDRVTVPFVGGCGKCMQCKSGNQQVCDYQFQPGFTAWGGFAEYTAIDYADENLVRLPEEMVYVTAASLGCRFITSYRAVVDQARVTNGEWVTVFGCGGVGLSAIMIAKAFGAKVLAVDIADKKLEFASVTGADATLNSTTTPETYTAVKEITNGGSNVTIDALGKASVIYDAIRSLAKRGRHIQIGLLEKGATDVAVAVDLIIANELQIVGSHGMQAHRFPEMFELISTGRLEPEKLVGLTVPLSEATSILASMDRFDSQGVTVINRFTS